MKSSITRCDALEFLERLEGSTADVVYLDPPWNTHSVFNLDVPTQESYEAFMSKVFEQCKRILKETGSLFLYSSPQHNSDFYLSLNTIFARENFVAEFIIPVNTGISSFGNSHDTLILFRKSKNQKIIFQVKPVDVTAQKKLYPFHDDLGWYRKESLQARGDRPMLVFEWKGVRPPSGFFWKVVKAKMEEMFADGLIGFSESTGVPFKKRYFNENDQFEKVGSIWSDIPSKLFDPRYNLSQHPAIFKRIFSMIEQPEGLLVDPFCGSGSSLISAASFGMYFKACDDNEQVLKLLRSELKESRPDLEVDYLTSDQILHLPIQWNDYTLITEDEKVFELIRAGESDKIEFKQSACYNHFRKCRDATIMEVVLKSIVGFLNADGGIILIGVCDDKTILGLVDDFGVANPQKNNEDGLELFLRSKIHSALGVELSSHIIISFHKVNNKDICKIAIAKSKEAVFYDTNFYLRTGNQTVLVNTETFYKLRLREYLIDRPQC